MRPPHPLAPSASPFTRLDLPPAPLVDLERLNQAKRSALSVWSPLKVSRLHQPLAIAQRALVQRDAARLSRRVGSLSAYYEHVVTPLAQAQCERNAEERREEEREMSSPSLEEAFTQRLYEGVSLLESELIALESPLVELVDVDAHYERYKLTARLARFHQLYTSYLGEALRCVALNLQAPTPCVALQQAPPAPREGDASDELDEPDASYEPNASDEPDEPDEPDERSTREGAYQGKGKRPSYRQLTHLRWSPRFQPLIERQLSLLTRLSDELERFDQPTRPRWGRS